MAERGMPSEPVSGVVYDPQTKIGADPEFDGQHLWMVIASWKVDPIKLMSGSQVLMDQENLISVSSVAGCYHCEQVWEWPLHGKPCPGDPDGSPRRKR